MVVFRAEVPRGTEEIERLGCKGIAQQRIPLRIAIVTKLAQDALHLIPRSIIAHMLSTPLIALTIRSARRRSSGVVTLKLLREPARTRTVWPERS
jgi:hypothetical protein